MNTTQFDEAFKRSLVQKLDSIDTDLKRLNKILEVLLEAYVNASLPSVLPNGLSSKYFLKEAGLEK